MRGILKKVAGAFVEIKEDEPVKKEAVKIPVPLTGTATVNQSAIDEFTRKFRSILEEENKRNFPGNDYYEFKVMKDAMNAIPQETLRYQAAFAGWSTGGSQSKKNLLDTAQVYLGLVNKEISEFETAYQAQYSAQVTNNEQIIQQKSKRVQSLKDEIAQLENEIHSLTQQNQENKASLTSKHDAFVAAGNSQRQEITDEIDKINQYIN